MSDQPLIDMFIAVGGGGLCLGCRFSGVVLKGWCVWGCQVIYLGGDDFSVLVVVDEILIQHVLFLGGLVVVMRSFLLNLIVLLDLRLPD